MLIPSAFDPAQAPNSEPEPVLGWPEIRAAWVKPRAHPQCGRLGFLLWGGVLGIRALVTDPGIHNVLSFARTFSFSLLFRGGPGLPILHRSRVRPRVKGLQRLLGQ